MGDQSESYRSRFDRTHTAADLAAAFVHLQAGESAGTTAAVAGRVMAVREHGRATFVVIRDGSGEVQLFLSQKVLEHDAYAASGDLGVGDWVGATGEVVRTRRGELSVMPTQIVLLSKAVRPLPEKWHGLRDVETRYRQRYVDLIVNPDVRRVFELRSGVVTEVRAFLVSRGFLEVETPMLQPIPGGAAAKPFVTHHNVLDTDLYLRIAPELYLKRLLVGGFERVFELNRNFRNEGVSTKHNPEFTMLEVYQAFADYTEMMELTLSLIRHVAETVLGTLEVTQHDGTVIDLGAEWRVATLTDLVSEAAGQEVSIGDTPERLGGVCRANDVTVQEGWGSGKLLVELFEKLVEGTLVQPTFVTHYPLEVTPLARKSPEQPLLTERFELIAAGKELANAFSELTDPADQRARFESQAAAAAKGDEEAPSIVDEDYLRALEYGMPPAGGLGIGIDRLVMLLTGTASIRDVLLFPQLRPES
jgi:lysyl-tRNA synthetase class 2